jgi:hypothetical protein
MGRNGPIGELAGEDVTLHVECCSVSKSRDEPFAQHTSWDCFRCASELSWFPRAG